MTWNPVRNVLMKMTKPRCCQRVWLLVSISRFIDVDCDLYYQGIHSCFMGFRQNSTFLPKEIYIITTFNFTAFNVIVYKKLRKRYSLLAIRKFFAFIFYYVVVIIIGRQWPSFNWDHQLFQYFFTYLMSDMTPNWMGRKSTVSSHVLKLKCFCPYKDNWWLTLIYRSFWLIENRICLSIYWNNVWE